jgi:DNA-binding response OmpR family regulator
LILLDVMMPGLTGIEVCQKIREQHVERPVIIMYTADDRDVTRQASIKAGANEVLTKDTPVDQLAACLAAYLKPAHC